VKKELLGCQFSSDDALHTASIMMLQNISHGGFLLAEICMHHTKILQGIQSVTEYQHKQTAMLGTTLPRPLWIRTEPQKYLC
jgi:hypothetical protein